MINFIWKAVVSKCVNGKRTSFFFWFQNYLQLASFRPFYLFVYFFILEWAGFYLRLGELRHQVRRVNLCFQHTCPFIFCLLMALSALCELFHLDQL